MKAVLLDWRGTLAVQPSELDWMVLGRRAAGLADDPAGARAALQAVGRVLRDAPPDGWARQDTDADLHRRVHLELFERAGLAPRLAEALYQVLGDLRHDVMADDVPETLRHLADACDSLVVVSDIHVDVRPWFADHGLDRYVADFVLSFEHGVQKPDAEIFRLALAAAGVAPDHALMVGDRAAYDGGAVSVGIPTLILPPLRSPSDRRLHLAVRAAAGNGS